MLFVPSVEYNIIAYTHSEGLCVYCDGRDRWFNVECTTIKKKKLPEIKLILMFTFVKNAYTS